MDHATTRIAWWGANGQWKNVGLFMFGMPNPHPEKPIAAIEVQAIPPASGAGGIMLAAISFSDQPVQFEVDIRSYGLPDCWAQAAITYAVAEGLAGIEDRVPAFPACESPRAGPAPTPPAPRLPSITPPPPATAPTTITSTASCAASTSTLPAASAKQTCTASCRPAKRNKFSTMASRSPSKQQSRKIELHRFHSP